MTTTPTCPVPPAVAEHLVLAYLADLDATAHPAVPRLVAAITAALAVPTPVRSPGQQYVSRADLVVALAAALAVTP